MKENNMKKKQKKKAIVVARTATKDQKSGQNLKSQLRWAELKAKELDAAIVHIFSFNGMSGNSFLEAYAEQILDTICQQKIDYFLVYGLDRLTRNLCQGTHMLNEILKLGCTIVTSSGIIDTKSDLFLPNIEMAIDECIFKLRCKKCDGTNLIKNGVEMRKGHIIQKYICKKCGYHFRFPSHKQLDSMGAMS